MMYQYNSTKSSVQFKDDPSKSMPFPPEYYENERKAKAMIEKMVTPPQKMMKI